MLRILFVIKRFMHKWNTICHGCDFEYCMRICIYENYSKFTSFDFKIIILVFIPMILIITILTTTIIILHIHIVTITINIPSNTINCSQTQNIEHKAMTIGNLCKDNQTLLIISILIYNNYISMIINSIINKGINTQITDKIQTFQRYIIYCNMISYACDCGYCIKFWISKNHFVLVSFDYTVIILLFIIIVLLVTIKTITIIIINTSIITIPINFPSINSIAQYKTYITITIKYIGYLNNENDTLLMKPMLICINYIRTIINLITTNRSDPPIINKIKLSKHGINGINGNNLLCLWHRTFKLQHSILWHYELWNV